MVDFAGEVGEFVGGFGGGGGGGGGWCCWGGGRWGSEVVGWLRVGWVDVLVGGGEGGSGGVGEGGVHGEFWPLASGCWITAGANGGSGCLAEILK